MFPERKPNMISLHLKPVLQTTQQVLPTVFFTSLFLFVCLFILEAGSHSCSPSWPGTCDIDQSSLELTAVHLLSSLVLELQAGMSHDNQCYLSYYISLLISSFILGSRTLHMTLAGFKNTILKCLCNKHKTWSLF